MYSFKFSSESSVYCKFIFLKYTYLFSKYPAASASIIIYVLSAVAFYLKLYA